MLDTYKKIETIGEECENQYLLALAIARRVRKLRSGAPPMVECDNPKRNPFLAATKEIAQGKITYTINSEKN